MERKREGQGEGGEEGEGGERREERERRWKKGKDHAFCIVLTINVLIIY
jgi:hypothetical protein